MVFAEQTFAGNVFNTLLFLGVCFWIISWRLKKIDPEGKVMTTARSGLIGVLGRLWK